MPGWEMRKQSATVCHLLPSSPGAGTLALGTGAAGPFFRAAGRAVGWLGVAPGGRGSTRLLPLQSGQRARITSYEGGGF